EPVPGHRRHQQGGDRLGRFQPRFAQLNLRRDPDPGARQDLCPGAVLVRQRMGLLEPHGRGRRPFRRDGVGLRRDTEDTVQASDAPVIVIHSLTHAVAALRVASEAGRPIILASPPDAGIYAGSGWFREVLFAARAAAPAAQSTAVLDCGDDAGAAMAALRAGLEAIVFTERAELSARLAD